MNQGTNEVRNDITAILRNIATSDDIENAGSVDKILALIPQWKQFAPDCLPDKGKEILLKYKDGTIRNGRWKFDNKIGKWKSEMFSIWPERYAIEQGFQFFEIP